MQIEKPEITEISLQIMRKGLEMKEKSKCLSTNFLQYFLDWVFLDMQFKTIAKKDAKRTIELFAKDREVKNKRFGIFFWR